MDSLNKPKIEKAKPIQPPEKRAEFEVAKEKVGQKYIERKETERLPREIEQTISPPSVGQPGIDVTDSPLHQLVESILEEGLEELYFSMDEKHQLKFKKKGEATASQIIKLIQSAKATFKKVFNLIKSWLKMIPGVNKFFIEQEAKIKADKILEIERQ